MRIASLYLRAAMVAAPIFTVSALRAEESSAKPIKSSASVTTLSASPPLAGSDYELGGFFGTGETLEVSLKKSGEADAKWVRVGRKTGNLLVESADPKKGFAIVNISGARYRLDLRGEKETRLPVKTIGSQARTFTASASLANPPKRLNESPEMKKKREQFESIMAGMTPEQHRRIGETLGNRMREMLKNNPELAKGGDPKEMQRLSREAFRDGIRDALQMPGKDGAAGSVPGDFNDLFDAGTTGEAPSAGAAVATSVQVIAVDPASGPEGGAEPAAAPAPDGAVQVQVLSVGSGSVSISGGGGVAPAPAPTK
jgi:hypothetical protein